MTDIQDIWKSFQDHQHSVPSVSAVPNSIPSAGKASGQIHGNINQISVADLLGDAHSAHEEAHKHAIPDGGGHYKFKKEDGNWVSTKTLQTKLARKEDLNLKIAGCGADSPLLQGYKDSLREIDKEISVLTRDLNREIKRSETLLSTSKKASQRALKEVASDAKEQFEVKKLKIRSDLSGIVDEEAREKAITAAETAAEKDYNSIITEFEKQFGKKSIDKGTTAIENLADFKANMEKDHGIKFEASKINSETSKQLEKGKGVFTKIAGLIERNPWKSGAVAALGAILAYKAISRDDPAYAALGNAQAAGYGRA